MVIALLQFELLIHDASSIKDKRRVVTSVKARLHREHQVSVAEVGLADSMRAARLGLALVSSDGRYAAGVLDRITQKLRALPDAELGECSRQMLRDADVNEYDEPEDVRADGSLSQEVLARGMERLDVGGTEEPG